MLNLINQQPLRISHSFVVSTLNWEEIAPRVTLKRTTAKRTKKAKIIITNDRRRPRLRAALKLSVFHWKNKLKRPLNFPLETFLKKRHEGTARSGRGHSGRKSLLFAWTSSLWEIRAFPLCSQTFPTVLPRRGALLSFNWSFSCRKDQEFCLRRSANALSST